MNTAFQHSNRVLAAEAVSTPVDEPEYRDHVDGFSRRDYQKWDTERVSQRLAHASWYVAQVRGGSEIATRDACKKIVPEQVMIDCFAPEYETMWKTKGEWHRVKRLLFSGYLFFVTSDIDALYAYLQKVPALVRLLGNDDEVFYSLTDKERDWFVSFMDDVHVVRMSEGYIKGDTIVVTRGPLRGVEGCIRKIDRHKRRAYIDVSLFGRTVPASVGLEIVRKTA